jgi:hypothetical protein
METTQASLQIPQYLNGINTAGSSVNFKRSGSARDMEYFTIDNEHYLAIANHAIGMFM